MNILHVIASMDPKMGGVCQAVRTMVKGLEVWEVPSEVVCLDAMDASFLKDNSFPIHPMGIGKGPWSYNSSLIPWLVKNLSRFDAVILHGLWLYPSFALRKAMQLYKKKGDQTKSAPAFFVMPHGMLDPYFQRAPERRVKALRNWVFWKLVEGKTVNKANGVLFTCEDERQLAREPFKPYHPKQEIVVGLGVEEPPTFAPRMQKAFLDNCPSLQAGQPYLLFLSRIHEKKGVDLLLRSFKRSLGRGVKKIANSNLVEVAAEVKERPGEPIGKEWPILVIAGPGLETTYGQRIKALASELLIPENCIQFPGMLTGDAKWGALYGCEAFVLPSHQENFGIAVVEAMACGKPVLISNKVNIWREIFEAEAGLVANDTEPGTNALLEGWHSLSKEKKREMGAKARAAFEKQFAIQPNAKRLLDAIRA